MRSAKRNAVVEPRAKQRVASEISGFLLGLIRAKFYPGKEAEARFFKDRAFLLRMVVLRPAGWLSRRGVSLPGERYQEIVAKVIMEAAAHAESAPKYPPAFLGRCVESHFRVNEDAYYTEGKRMRALVDSVIATADASHSRQIASRHDPVADLARAKALLDSIARTRRKGPSSEKQLHFGF